MEKIDKFTQYLKEVKIETKKVTFPSRKDTVATTTVVIAVVLIIGAYLGLVDLLLSSVIGLALK